MRSPIAARSPASKACRESAVILFKGRKIFSSELIKFPENPFGGCTGYRLFGKQGTESISLIICFCANGKPFFPFSPSCA
jgi:hypothetical protein